MVRSIIKIPAREGVEIDGDARQRDRPANRPKSPLLKPWMFTSVKVTLLVPGSVLMALSEKSL